MPKDRNGKVVKVGSKVKVVHIDPKFIASLPDNERDDVASMLNEVFEVYDVDDYGKPWVEKVWHMSDDQTISHSLALLSNEMELV